MVFTFFFLLILFYLVQRTEGNSEHFNFNPYLLPIFFIYISSLLSSFFSPYIYKSLLFFQPYIIIFTFFLLISTESDTKLLKDFIAKIIVASNIFFIAICLTKLFFNITYKGFAKASLERPWVSKLLPPTYLSENIIIFVILIFGFLLSNSGLRKFLLGILVGIDLMLLGIVRSKGSILGLLAGFL